jgi:tetratricopeptide (TPR) repeat protein
MRWATTLGAWTRREAALVSALAVGAAIAALAVPLGVPWLAVVGAVVAALGALARVVIAVRRGALERAREDVTFARLVRVAAASVAQVDPTLVGVDRAVQQILPGAGVPAYQPRTVDGDLVAALRAALDASGPWMVVVHGPSKVGKSRSLFEALRVCDRAAPVQLVAPVDAGALQSLMTPGEGLRPGSGAAALWLDDLEPFLNSGVTWSTLCEWHASAPQRIVVATYGGKGSALIAGSQTGGLATIASEVLGNAREIALQKTTPDELVAVRAQIDPGEGAALARHGLAAYLVAGPALERKLSTARHAPGEDACPDGVTLVNAAVDWSRCGRSDPIADDTLRALWASYLPSDASAADSDYQRALSWARARVVGDIALLHGAGSYEAFDYVIRLVRDSSGARVPPDGAWDAAIANAADAQALGVATAAYYGGRLDDARRALTAARQSTVDEVAALAGYNLGVVLGDLAQPEEEVVVYDDVVARFGDATEAALRERVAGALVNKGVRLGALERFEEAVVVYDDVVARFGETTEPIARQAVAFAQQALEQLRMRNDDTDPPVPTG